MGKALEGDWSNYTAIVTVESVDQKSLTTSEKIIQLLLFEKKHFGMIPKTISRAKIFNVFYGF